MLIDVPAPRLAKGRRYSNGNAFSTGHYLLGKGYYMIDIDRLKLRADVSISKQNSVFVEYEIRLDEVEITALFSLKHNQARLGREGQKRAFDFVNDVSNAVLRAMCRKLGCRLFVVFHGDNEEPPFDIREVDVKTGSTVSKALITGNTEDAWMKAWHELNLMR